MSCDATCQCSRGIARKSSSQASRSSVTRRISTLGIEGDCSPCPYLGPPGLSTPQILGTFSRNRKSVSPHRARRYIILNPFGFRLLVMVHSATRQASKSSIGKKQQRQQQDNLDAPPGSMCLLCLLTPERTDRSHQLHTRKNDAPPGSAFHCAC